MALDGTESCCSSATEHAKNHPDKLESYREVLHRLSSREEACRPGFEEELSSHFNRLPARYAMDVNVERAEDVLTHMKLLQQATDPQKRPVFVVRVVQVPALNVEGSATFPNDDTQGEEHTLNRFSQKSVHPLPMFGSSANLEALAIESPKKNFEDSVSNANMIFSRPMYEVTFASDDRPKLLSKLTTLLGEVNLNIEEAHAFSTNNGYSLDVFVVKGQNNEGIEQLTHSIENEVQKIRDLPRPTHHPLPAMLEQKENGKKHEPDYVKIPTDETDVWEIDIGLLKFGKKVASGSYGDLYRGTYRSQDVAIKMLKPERVSPDLQKEFKQEVYIMRKVRHKNVVQFIGACTRTPYLCIVTEFMSKGSLYDYLHKNNGSFKLPALIRVAIDISKGMNYLHQNNIIHRDLKAANLLMDENEVVKVADFGVARVKSESGVMTAETGTYRWMAPEVIEHKRYDHKCDVFSFGIVLWELLTRQIPYECYTPLQAAVGVVQKNLRPTIPNTTHPKLAKLLEKCWQQDPSLRPDFSEILEILQGLAKDKEFKDDPNARRKEKSAGGFLHAFRL